MTRRFAFIRFSLAAAACFSALWAGSASAQTTQPPFSRFFSGDLSKKTIVVWGNSTVAFEAPFLQTLAQHAAPGDVFEGLTVTPEGDNPDKPSPDFPGQPSRNVNGHLHRLGNIINMGNNGATLKGLLGPTSGSKPYTVDALCAAKPDLLIVRGPLINDVRQGACDLACAEGLQKRMLDQFQACSPGTDILLQIENSLLITDVGDHGFVKPQTPEAAQHYSEIMRQSGLSFVGKYPHVYVMDLQDQLYGTTARALSPLMKDQLHPGPEGQIKEAELVVKLLAGFKKPQPAK